jgi:plastocyanin
MSRLNRTCLRVLGAALALCLLAPVGAASAQEPVVVDMQGLAYVPVELHVVPGTTVVWTNSSPLAHTVTADDASFDSGNIDAGGTFEMFFEAPGFYTYFCAPHQALGMMGVVVVDDPAATGGGEDVGGAAGPPPAVEREYVPDH